MLITNESLAPPRETYLAPLVEPADPLAHDTELDETTEWFFMIPGYALDDDAPEDDVARDVLDDISELELKCSVVDLVFCAAE